MAKELYERLGVSETASEQQILEAYNRKCADSAPEMQASLKEAYDILSDLEQRAYYDIRGTKPGRRHRRSTTSSGSGSRETITNIRTALNMVFMLGALITVILYVMHLSGGSSTPFFWACGISLAIKIVEYLLRLFR